MAQRAGLFATKRFQIDTLSEQPAAIRGVLIGGADGATLSTSGNGTCPKIHDAGTAEGTGRTSIDGAAETTGKIFDQRDFESTTDRSQLRKACRISKDTGGDDGASLLAEAAFDTFGIDVECAWMTVGVDRTGAYGYHGVSHHA